MAAQRSCPQVLHLRFGERRRSCTSARSADGTVIHPPPRRAAIPRSWRAPPVLGPLPLPGPLDGSLSALGRQLRATPSTYNLHKDGYGHLLFELNTQVCGSCVPAAVAGSQVDRRAIRLRRPRPLTGTRWALERLFRAPLLPHRCSMVATMPPTTAAGPHAAASGRQQRQQRATRRVAAWLAAVGSRGGQPRGSPGQREQRRGDRACAARMPPVAPGPEARPPRALGDVQRRLWWLGGSVACAGRAPCSHLSGGCTAHIRV